MAIKTMEFYIKLAKWFERITDKERPNHKIANRTIVVDLEWLVRTDGLRALFRRVPDGMVVCPDPELGIELNDYALGQILGVTWKPGMAEKATGQIVLNAKFLKDAIVPGAALVSIMAYSQNEPAVVACFDDYGQAIGLSVIMPKEFSANRRTAAERIDALLTRLHAAPREREESAKRAEEAAAAPVDPDPDYEPALDTADEYVPELEVA